MCWCWCCLSHQPSSLSFYPPLRFLPPPFLGTCLRRRGGGKNSKNEIHKGTTLRNFRPQAENFSKSVRVLPYGISAGRRPKIFQVFVLWMLVFYGKIDRKRSQNAQNFPPPAGGGRLGLQYVFWSSHQQLFLVLTSTILLKYIFKII